MVNQELAVVHTFKQFNMCLWVQFLQVFYLRFGYEGLFGAVPEVNVRSVNGIQFMSVDVLVTIKHSPPLPLLPHLLAFIQQHVEVMGMEHPFPEAGPMVTGPYVGTLIIAKRAHQPFW